MDTFGPTFARLTVVDGGPPRQPNGQRRIAIVGTGYVGLVTGACFAELGNTVVCIDNDREKIAMLRAGNVPFFEPRLLDIIVESDRAGRLSFSDDLASGVRDSEIIFIAVGTPTRSDGEIDLSAVLAVAETIGRELDSPKILAVKSTVPVGTCEAIEAIVAEHSRRRYRVDVVSNPEFLREGSAVADFLRPDRVVVGTSDPQTEAALRELYAPLDAPLFVTDVRSSEMIKYASNAFLATKVSFMNEIANICELFEADPTAVRRGMGFDRRIGTEHMSPGIGYGGSCFPKDVQALERAACHRGYEATLLRSVEAVNKAQIQRSIARIEGALGGPVAGMKVCVLGLSFKPNTSDVREAPALYLIDSLRRRGANVVAHDPVAIENARALTGAGVGYRSGVYDAIEGCDVLCLATEWSEYKAIDFGAVRRMMRGNVVFDGRGFFDAREVVTEGLWYVGVGGALAPARVTYLEALGE